MSTSKVRLEWLSSFSGDPLSSGLTSQDQDKFHLGVNKNCRYSIDKLENFEFLTLAKNQEMLKQT